MLNDVLSLCVGLWAVKVAQSGSSKMYTYGWQRAETLGALVNGVFLVALCVTIFLEAIQRFVEKPNVTNPKLVLIVGCMGLASNILGLVLFHDVGHSHSHGGEGHSHGDGVSHAEEGHAHSHSHGHEHAHDEHSHETEQSPLMSKTTSSQSKRDFSKRDEDDSTVASMTTPNRRGTLTGNESTYRHRRRTSGFGSVDNIQIHPASFRNDIIQAARYQDEPHLEDVEEALSDPNEDHHQHDHTQTKNASSSSPNRGYGATSVSIAKSNAHHNHIHNQPREPTSGGGHGHNHADLNMRGVFLHVLGDALGNVGVIATALIIWLTTFEGRFYFDPAISLVITAIILTSAIPLCKAASRILLQAVPMGMSIDEIRADIEDLPRVVEAHHLHVWQLSDTKLVASLHVKVDCDVKGAGSASYMQLAREIRACLHGYGIHSSTIQPEFLKSVPSQDLLDENEGSSSSNDGGSPGHSHANGHVAAKTSKAGSLISADGQTGGTGCLMDCEDTCGSDGQCCPSTDGVGQR